MPPRDAGMVSENTWGYSAFHRLRALLLTHRLHDDVPQNIFPVMWVTVKSQRGRGEITSVPELLITLSKATSAKSSH